MKEQKENESGTVNEKKKKAKMNKEKRFYLFTAIGCAAALVAIIVVAVVMNNLGAGNNQAAKPPIDSSQTDGSGDSSGDSGDSGTNQPVGGLPEGMTLPVAEAALVNNHGFYYNKTLDVYYEHAGVDFAAGEGAQVFAVEDGVVESIYKDDLLLGGIAAMGCFVLHCCPPFLLRLNLIYCVYSITDGKAFVNRFFEIF